MRKILLLSGLILILLMVGCSQQSGEAVGPYPTDIDGVIGRFVREGWNAYNDGEYELAYARFDSAVKLNAAESGAYLGLGYSNIQLGYEDDSRFGLAKSAFGFLPTLEGGSPIVEMSGDTIAWGDFVADSSLFTLGVESSETPLLGVTEPVVKFSPGPATSNVDPQDVNIVRVTDNTIVTEPTRYTSGPDSSEIYIPGNPGDAFIADYSYYSGDMTNFLAMAFAGVAQASQIQGKDDSKYLLESIIYANAVLEKFGTEGSLREDTLTVPTYIDPAINSRNVRILLAQSYFYNDYLYNCMWELWRLDSTLTFDPSSPTFKTDLQKALADL